jgi:hypothetical protein
MAELIIFCSLAHTSPTSFPDHFQPGLEASLARSIEELNTELQRMPANSDNQRENIHQVIYSLLSYIDVGSLKPFSAKIAHLFIILKSVRLDGSFQDPSSITKILSALMWGFRASALYQIHRDLRSAIGKLPPETSAMEKCTSLEE